MPTITISWAKLSHDLNRMGQRTPSWDAQIAVTCGGPVGGIVVACWIAGSTFDFVAAAKARGKREQERETGEEQPGSAQEDEGAGEQQDASGSRHVAASMPSNPGTEASLKLWGSNSMVPLAVVGFHEEFRIIGGEDQQSARILERLMLMLLQSSTELLSTEIAKRKRAEKLAQELNQLSRIRSAKSGWNKAKRIGKG